jgi:hypothetical protein
MASRRRWSGPAILTAALLAGGAIGYFGAEGLSSATTAAGPAIVSSQEPPSWRARLPELIEPAAGDALAGVTVSESREFADAPEVVEGETQQVDARPTATGPQFAALTPGPDLDREANPGPRIGDGPTAAWRFNAVPFADRPGRRLVAIIIDDAGMDRARTARALRLPGPLTISFLPYAPDVARQAEEAKRRGHELMVHLPMEPVAPQENPGPDALTTRLPRSELMRRLALHLKRFDGYVGANNHMGSRMTADAGAMLPVLEELRDQGLLYVDSRTTRETVAALLADHLRLPAASRDVFIDHEQITGSVRARLADIERIARKNGQVVAIGHPHDRTLEELERWLPTLAEQGLTVAPVSAVVLRRQGKG